MSLAKIWRNGGAMRQSLPTQVLGRTVESMNTKAGRHIAERRYRSTLALLSLWAREAREAGVDLQGELNFEISFDYDGLSEE